ncbi:hypothetical protein D3C73_1299850 [compost metagenome]
MSCSNFQTVRYSSSNVNCRFWSARFMTSFIMPLAFLMISTGTVEDRRATPLISMS